MKLRPMGDRLIAKQFDDDRIGSIIIPDSSKKTSLRATVISAGPQCDFVKVGDTILFGRFARFDLPLRDEKWKDCFIMNEADVLCILEDEDNA